MIPHPISMPHVKTMLRTVAFALCALFATVRAAADTFQVDGMTYETTSDTTCSLTRGLDTTEVVIPQEVSYSGQSYTVTEIGEDAFRYRTSLKAIHLPATLTSIGYGAFFHCDSLASIALPAALTSIEPFAFYNCKSLASIKLPAGLTTIKGSVFFHCASLTSIDLPAGLTSIGEEAFRACTSLSRIDLPATLTAIWERAFYNCSGLTSVRIPAAVTTIGEACFAYCAGLKEIQVESENSYYQSQDGVLFNKDLSTLLCYPGGKEDERYAVPYTVTTIDTLAFYGNQLLQTLQIPAATSRLKGNISYGTGLHAIEIAADNEQYQSVDGVLFDKDLKTLCAYPRGKEETEYTIPTTVTSIGEYAFDKCALLKNVKIPESVTSIGGYAFHDCYGLNSVKIPESVTSIGGYAFYYCYGLNNVKIPESVTSIGAYAFTNCTRVKSIEIRSSVATIGNCAFYRCDSVIDVVCYATEPYETSYNYTLFYSPVYTTATLYVPEESITAYRTSEYCWSKFQNIQPLSQYAALSEVTLSGEASESAVVYDLRGVRVHTDADRLAPGFYVVRQGGGSRTVLVK